MKLDGTIKLDIATMTYVIDIKNTGLFGNTIDEVVEGLVLQGVRNAIDDGHIKVRTFEISDDN